MLRLAGGHASSSRRAIHGPLPVSPAIHGRVGTIRPQPGSPGSLTRLRHPLARSPDPRSAPVSSVHPSLCVRLTMAGRRRCRAPTWR